MNTTIIFAIISFIAWTIAGLMAYFELKDKIKESNRLISSTFYTLNADVKREMHEFTTNTEEANKAIVKRSCEEYLARRIDDINKSNPEIVLIDKDDAITPSYLMQLFPYLSEKACKELTDYCYLKTIYSKQCFGNGTPLIQKFLLEKYNYK